LMTNKPISLKPSLLFEDLITQVNKIPGMSKEDNSSKIMAWQSIRDRIPETLRATVDHIVSRKPFPTHKMWKEIDNLLADTVAKSSGSISNIDTVTESPALEQILNYIATRNNNNNFNDTRTFNNNKTFTKKPYSKPTYADATKVEAKPQTQRVDDRPFPSRDDKSTWRFPDRDGFCYFHQRFGRQATKCREPCSFDPNYRPRRFQNNYAQNASPTTSASATQAEPKSSDKAPLNA